MRSFRFAFISLLLTAAPLLARDVPTITSLSPSSVFMASGEWFLTIDGTHYLPTAGVTVTFSGPSGTVSIVPNASTDSEMVVWVPFPVLLSPGNYAVTVQAPDGRILLTSNAMTFKVIGNNLVLHVPIKLLVEATSLKGAMARFEVTAESLFGGQTSVDCSSRSGDQFPLDVTKVDCKATDEFGDSAGDSFEILVADTTPPQILVPKELTAFGKSDGTSVKYEVSVSDVVDPEVVVKCSPESGSFFPIGTTPIKCTSEDRFRNVATTTFRIHVGSDEIPALFMPESLTAEAASREGAFVSFDATATDSFGKPADVRCDPKSGSLFPMGVTTVKCTGFGPNGKSTTDVFDLRVADTTAPRMLLPRDVRVQASRPEGEVVSYTASANDSVDGESSVGCFPASGLVFAPGVTVVNCSATDKAGNTANGSFVVTVIPFEDETVYSRPGLPGSDPDLY